MGKAVIKTDRAHAPRAHYSQAVRAGDFIYVSGLLAIDPRTGELVRGGVREQTAAVLENLKALLEASGSSLGDVAKVTVFLKDIRDIGAMNEAFKAYFPRDPPARSTIEAKLASPEFLVEIEAVAYVGR
ncbi:MAG: Rid family detoxifying hydrolase [Candidatus Bathyarchaeia archaeon]